MSVPSGFWGLVVEPSKMYSQTVPATFKLTMASLGPESEAASTGKAARNTLMLKLDENQEFAICSLTSGKTEQQPLDLVFNEGENIAFHIEGQTAVHLTGYYLVDAAEDDFINDEEEDEVYSDEAEEDSQIEYDSEFDSEDYDSECSDECSEDEYSDEESCNNPRIRVLDSDESEAEAEDSEEESEDSEEEDEEDSEEESEQEPETKKRSVQFDLPESKKVKENESPKQAQTKPAQQQAAKPSQTQAAQQQKPTQTQVAQQNADRQAVNKTLPSGLQIQDLKLGTGPKVTQGRAVLIHYKGTLLNGKVFDSSYGKKPLKFKVGKGDVIKGMDMGVMGMHVGGSRKLVIPANLAYGKQSLPGIPANSTLVFEISVEKLL